MSSFILHSLDAPDEITQRKLNVAVRILRDEAPTPENPILIMDNSVAVEAVVNWRRLLPRVKPFYAIKANADERLLAALHCVGCGFDCASKKEMESVLRIGVEPDEAMLRFEAQLERIAHLFGAPTDETVLSLRAKAEEAVLSLRAKAEEEMLRREAQPADIVFSNGSKFESHVAFAAEKGIKFLVFDCEDEMDKLLRLYPTCLALLRVSVKSETSLHDLSRSGAKADQIPILLRKAAESGLNVVGIHFHVGFGLDNTAAFRSAIAAAATAFAAAQSLGLQMSVLDIGGGFPGFPDSLPDLSVYASAINSALDEFFPEGEGVRVIAEPGRYIACRTTGLLVKIVTKRVTLGPSGRRIDYCINDGVFGNLSFIKDFPFGVRNVSFLTRTRLSMEFTYPTFLSGPTGCHADVLQKELQWPELDAGDFVFMDDNGAYAVSMATNFNGFGKDLNRIVYV